MRNMKIKFGNQEIELSNKVPQKEGYYIWQSTMFKQVSQPEILHVVWYPPKFDYGMQWDGFWGILNYRGRNVGIFSRPTDFWSEEITW